MIDWMDLFGNALWITGLAGALAVLGYASWEASARGKKTMEVLDRRSYSLGFSLSGLLFTGGLAISSLGGWRALLWGVIAAGFVALTLYFMWDMTRR